MYLGRLQQKRSSYRKSFLAVIGVIAAVIFFVVYLSISKAEIVVHPKYENVSLDFNAEVVGDGEESENKIKGRILATAAMGNEKITEVDKKETDKQATGKVIIYNKLDHDQSLLATTRLLSKDGVLFRTKKQVVAKAHGEIEAEVYADEPGKKGELAPTKFTIPGLWQDWQNKIYAESKEPMTGGFGEADFISQEVIDKGKYKAREEIKKQGMEEFKKNLSSSEKIMEDAVKIDDISVSTKAAPDSLGSEFVVNVEIRLTAVVFDEENLRKLAEERLLNQIPENKEFLEFDKDSFKCSLETYDLEKKEATFATHLEAKTISKLDEKLFDTEKLIGRTKAEVVEYLKEQKDVGEVQVEFKPFWVKTVPSQKDKVKLDIKDFDK